MIGRASSSDVAVCCHLINSSGLSSLRTKLLALVYVPHPASGKGTQIIVNPAHTPDNSTLSVVDMWEVAPIARRVGWRAANHLYDRR
jgi:hypothetical protein